MENLTINLKTVNSFISTEEIIALAQKAVVHLDTLNEKNGPGNDFLGWMSLPDDILPQLNRLEEIAGQLRSVSDITVVIGIGGSYLGSKAIIEALSNSFASLGKEKQHQVIYAGQNICEDYISDLLELLDDKNYSIVVISKSGTTTEPAIAFRILKRHLEKKIGKKKASERIVAITDSSKGALRSMAEVNGYKTFVIPEDVGGRYSVLTPAGLLPIAIAGFNIRTIVEGAKSMEQLTRYNRDAISNPALLYAAARNLLLKNGKSVEIMVGFTPKLLFLAEWWKQLFGESEGKEGKGIFPASANMTTDLHSLGQYIQEGQRIIFETIISVKTPSKTLTIPLEEDNSDQLNYIAGKRVSEVNHFAEVGTILAHNDGAVPVIGITVPSLNAYYTGQLIYFFEIACAVSGYILDINPFDQPGVEAYKNNMFALLNKPGFEDASIKIKEKLKQ